jgi:type IV secretory pathway TraG/TraD family ATPase VirD4
VAVTEVLQKQKRFSVNDLYATLTKSDAKEMYSLLEGTDAAKYFTKDNAKTAASIVSVLMANIKSLKFLTDGNESNSFAVEHYLNSINEGGKNWLFLSTDPSARELTLPLNAALLEILISRMRRTRTAAENRIWIVIDELPSLGKLPGLSELMQEGRKYGSRVLAGIQSTSQLYHHYGDADASSLIGLFKTKFAFSSDDPRMGELYSKLCGTKITISQQKNTSFGANEFRDGISYNEKQDKLPCIL